MRNKTERIMEKNSNKIMVICFCVAFITTLLILVGYLYYSTNTFKESQTKIVNEHIKHIAKVDSIFYDIKTVILSNDTGTIMNAPVLLSQLQKDSALFKREILLSQEEVNNLAALHIDKIDNDYSQIGIWGGLLSVIFLIFGFFAIFKIEETKAEAKNILDDVKEKGETAITQMVELQNQNVELNNSMTSIRQEGDTFIADKTKEFETLKKSIYDVQTQSKSRINEIDKLLEDVKVKDGQYKWSIEAMKKQMEQLNKLTDLLNNIIKNNGEEATNE